jgi:hypothetical protein
MAPREIKAGTEATDELAACVAVISTNAAGDMVDNKPRLLRAIGVCKKRCITALNLPERQRAAALAAEAKLPPDIWINYWRDSPDDHYELPMGSGQWTVSEWMWLCQAYTEAVNSPARINEERVAGRTVNDLWEELSTLREHWVLVTPDISLYPDARETFFAATVFLFSAGIRALQRTGRLGQCSVEGDRLFRGLAPPRPPPPEGKGEEKRRVPSSGSSRSSSDPENRERFGDEFERSFRERLKLDEKDAQLAVHQARSMFLAGVAVDSWIPMCANALMHLDIYAHILTVAFPLAPLTDEMRSAPGAVRCRELLDKWARDRSELVQGQEFNIPAIALSYELALPLGTLVHDRRKRGKAKVPFALLYKSAYGKERAEERDAYAKRKRREIYDDTKEATGLFQFYRDATVLFTYDYYFRARVSRRSFMDDHFVLAQRLRKSLPLLLNPDHKAAPVILQVGHHYYVKHNGRTWQTNGIDEALWFWTYTMATARAGCLDDGTDIGERWLSAFVPAEGEEAKT